MKQIVSKMKRPAAALLLCMMAAVSGCASSGGKSYTKDEARRAQTVQRGVIVSVQEVTIEQDSTLLGPAVGGTAGGVIGSTMGKGKGRILTTVGGAVVGAVLGAFGEKAVRTEQAYEFMIDLDGGGSISVVQAIDGDYAPGDKVRILRSSGNRARVVKGQ